MAIFEINSTNNNIDVQKLKTQIETATSIVTAKVISISPSSTGVRVVIDAPSTTSPTQINTLKTSVVDAHVNSQRKRVLISDSPDANGAASNKDYVDQKVADLVNSAPASLDTLKELATALNNDANFATTVTNALASKANTSSLATVATSGSYNDLTNRPTIPTTLSGLTGDVTLTSPSNGQVLQYNGTRWVNVPSSTVGATNLDGLSDVAIASASQGQFIVHDGTQFVNSRTIQANAASTIPLIIQGATSHSANLLDIRNSSGTSLFTVNASGSLSAGTVPVARVTGLATVATSGSYNDLSNRPTLATVATSGSYNDLSNRPTIPTTLSGLTGDVTLTSPSNGQVLQYNGTQWVNGTAQAGGATNLDGLSDVAVTSAARGQFIVHNGTQFVNSNTIHGTSGTIPLTIRLASFQSTNAFQIMDSANVYDLCTVNSSGQIFSGAISISDRASTGSFSTLSIRLASGQTTGSPFFIQNSSLLNIFAIDTSGSLTAGSIPVARITGTLPISSGGTGQTTAQAAINAITQVSSATNEHVLTKDTATGNAIWKANTPSYALPNGNIVNPSLYFVNDTNTGFFGGTTDNVLGFTANGQPVLTVSGTQGDGRLAVGDSAHIGHNLVSRLQIFDNDNNAKSGITFGWGTGTPQIYKSGTDQLQISASTLQIAATTPEVRVRGQNPVLNLQNVATTPGSGGVLRFDHDQTSAKPLAEIRGSLADGNVASRAGDLLFYTSTQSTGTLTEKMRIANNGVVYINTTSVQGGIVSSCLNIDSGSFGSGIGITQSVNTNVCIALQNTATSGNRFLASFYNNASALVGSISHNGVNASYNQSSDYRLKENISPMVDALDVVKLLKPSTWVWKSNQTIGQGFIAHELQEVIPVAVVGIKDEVDSDGNPVYQGVDPSYIVSTLTAAIKELLVKVETLEARLALVENKE